MDPATVCFFVPPNLAGFKQNLFDRVAKHIAAQGGQVIRDDFSAMETLPDEVVPIVGCSPELSPIVHEWLERGRQFIYWDRGYARRCQSTDLPRGHDGGYYRWHIGSFQMQSVRTVAGDRWKALRTDVYPWRGRGKHIVVAEPPPTYRTFHRIEDWTEKTVAALRGLTDRRLVVRTKQMQAERRFLKRDLANAHCLVTHGSNAAVEAVIMGCPVFVDQSSAAALVGKTDLGEIEEPARPDRQAWLNSLAYCQFNERELVDGTLWKLLA
jgi:hypothetical protein